jgi:hypothetical protein
MAQLAFFTIGILHEPWGHERVQGFVDRAQGVLQAAEGCTGFVDRYRRDSENPEQSFGEEVRPQCFGHIEDPLRLPSTLSLWDSLEAVAAYAYRGAHGEAMARRKEWFMSHEHPTYVAWWVEDGRLPTWSEAAERMDALDARGPTAHAFDFKSPFDPNGSPAVLDREKVRRYSAENSE